MLRYFLLLWLFSAPVWANTGEMQATLARIQHLLNRIPPLIAFAQQQQNPQARIQFQFNALRQDIAKIQCGIAQAEHKVTLQPRTVTPLVGDYVTVPAYAATPTTDGKLAP